MTTLPCDTVDLQTGHPDRMLLGGVLFFGSDVTKDLGVLEKNKRDPVTRMLGREVLGVLGVLNSFRGTLQACQGVLFPELTCLRGVHHLFGSWIAWSSELGGHSQPCGRSKECTWFDFCLLHGRPCSGSPKALLGRMV